MLGVLCARSFDILWRSVPHLLRGTACNTFSLESEWKIFIFFFACYTHIQVLTNCKSCFISNVIISISPPRDACCKEAVCDVGYLLDVAVNVLGG